MALKVEDLPKIHSEFPEIYEDLFRAALRRYSIAIAIKNEVINSIISTSQKEAKMKLRRGQKARFRLKKSLFSS